MESNPTSLLLDLRVVEIGSGIDGAFAARLLGDMGADVVKVEPPEGDPLRRNGIGRNGSAAQADVLFEYLNWNKSSVALTPGDADQLTQLVDDADIVIERSGPLDARAFGVDLNAARKRRPELVVVTISDFGTGGPYKGRIADDLVLHAMSGIMQISGTTDQPPLKPGLRQSRYGAGLNAAYAALAARLQSVRSGRGALVDVSVLECLASQLVLNEAHYAFMGAVQGRRPRDQDPLAGEPLPCADGWVSLQTSGLLGVERLVELFDDSRFEEWRFATAERRTQNAVELRSILLEHLRKRSGAEFFVEASTKGYLSGFVQTAEDLLDCPQLRARDALQGIATTSANEVFLPARLAAYSATPTEIRKPAPTIGQHTEQVLATAGMRPSVRTATPDNPHEDGPFSGMRVLDLSTVFAVPYMGALMADLGADVLKVEAPGRLDQTRTTFGRPYFDNDPGTDWWNRSATFQVVNRGKRSITLDLRAEAGRQILLDLVRDCDVVLDNYTPRVLRGWNLTYERLREVNPRLVMLSNTGYGSTGPWASFRAQGTTLEATMGLTEQTGYTNGPPSKFGQSYPDFLACWAGLGAITAALLHRESTGNGQWIDLGMYQLGAAVIPEALIAAQVPGSSTPRLGNHDVDSIFSGVFESSDSDRWVALSVHDETQRSALSALIDSDGTSKRLEVDVEKWCRQRTREEAVDALLSAGLLAGPVNDARDLLHDPQLRFRGFYEWIDFAPPLGARPIIGRPYRWDSNLDSSDNTAEGGPRIGAGGPRYGADNRAVLGRGLGLGDEEIAGLEAAGVIAFKPAQHQHPHGPMDLAALLASGELSAYDPGYTEDVRSLGEHDQAASQRHRSPRQT
ncbi:CoA transferase [Streptomyces sp. NBC_01356]|uniref:CaiB/BaiF CoA transferase family protein n=1 Tax=Streptomyces sp. NBC_01356 TaxID=2903836 RepID=UPI002E2EE4DF|nr:CoA transferase [Streptomyces sp. NBC_01356]